MSRPNSTDKLGRGHDKLKISRKHQRSSHELDALVQKLKSFRKQYKHSDSSTNPGIVFSPTLFSSKVRNTSVKIVITSPLATAPLIFTSNVETTIEHLISHAVCMMFEIIDANDSMDNYMLKITGKDEFLDPKFCLADYAAVNHCWKFDIDVKLTLIRANTVKKTFLRTSQDDFRCKSLLCPDDLLSREAILKFSDLNYEALSIIIEAFEREAGRLYNDVTHKFTGLQTQSLIQTTKAICTLMLNCETGQLTESRDNLIELCRSLRESGDSLEEEDRVKMIEVIQHAIKRLMKNMRILLQLTSKSLPVDYDVVDPENDKLSEIPKVSFPVNLLTENVLIDVLLVSQLKPEWSTKYSDYHLRVELMHGQNSLCDSISSSKVKLDSSFFPRLLFDETILFSLPYASLPREARVVISLYGTELPPPTSQSSVSSDYKALTRSESTESIASTTPMYSSSPRSSQSTSTNWPPNELVQSKLAVAISYLFNSDNVLKQGKNLLFFHNLEGSTNKDIYHEAITNRQDPILVIQFKEFPSKSIYFPNNGLLDQKLLDLSEIQKSPRQNHSYDKLDPGVKYVLDSIIYEKHVHEVLLDDEKSLVWENRLYLTSIPEALPKVLLSVPSWSAPRLDHIYELISSWEPLNPVDAIQLLLPAFPDAHIRALASYWLSSQGDDELYDYLPQLLQAFRYEKTIDCPLFWLLLARALKNVRIANLLYWQLKLISRDETIQERSEIMINCLLWSCGSSFWKSIDKQEGLMTMLTHVSSEIKKVRDSQRMSVLHERLQQVEDYLIEKKPTMPWAPGLEVCDLKVTSCSYFPSNTLPLKLAFRSCELTCGRSVEFHTFDTIFKVGDDLRQDMLAIQMIRIMEKLWLKEGLDLQMVTFDCQATNENQGMVEMVQNAETLRKIQQNCSLFAGAFNPKAIDSYIRLWNTSELEYKTALDRFLHSCAGYSVATYILGICDRHNDNIMVTNSGHLFHIDFGKFLGDAQMMGAIKRDRTPFVLTADMAYVINGGDRPSKKFQTFIELCTMGFNIIRRYRNLFLNLFSLMSSAKIHGLDSASVKYIDKMLMPSISEAEAMAKFTKLIDECLHSRSAQVNFFIHNLAQLRFSNDNSKQTLLSFVPKTFTILTDGKIESLRIVHLYKKYEPEKQYYYLVQVKRFGQPDVTTVTRTFREFSELQMKLNYAFPSYRFHDISKSTTFLMDIVGRTNTREVAQRRLNELRAFIDRLLILPPEISECDLIYTFFHPILRDQALVSSLDSSTSNNSSSTFGHQEYSDAQRSALYLGSNGQVKLSLSFKNSTLIIMIMHAKNLACPEGTLGPNCYAKTYLLPDPHKQTKRKTKVVRQSCHPSFMELITYEKPLEQLKRMTLQVSIWHSEIVQYKALMGAALIALSELDLSKEITSWYPLKNF